MGLKGKASAFIAKLGHEDEESQEEKKCASDFVRGREVMKTGSSFSHLV